MLRKLIHVRPRNQITLPQELVSRWKVLPGDYLRVQISDDGNVSLAPARLAVEGSPAAHEQNRQAEKDIEAGRYRTFEDVKGFVNSLEEEPVEVAMASALPAPPAIVEDIERALILAALQNSNWNKRAAAKRVVEGLKNFRFGKDPERTK
jgi:Bacterial regulatory protein, Fis family